MTTQGLNPQPQVWEQANLPSPTGHQARFPLQRPGSHVHQFSIHSSIIPPNISLGAD